MFDLPLFNSNQASNRNSVIELIKELLDIEGEFIKEFRFSEKVLKDLKTTKKLHDDDIRVKRIKPKYGSYHTHMWNKNGHKQKVDYRYE